ncbi:MAG TPA: (2E,6E)-farnesyl diphosphate synthase [Acidiferrobacteraceae bacterium]|nr:(2E,6E)-farnesyl diphosphate synthase [Acidiferrobacteraceae bacterium]
MENSLPKPLPPKTDLDSFQEQLQRYQSRIEEALSQRLPAVSQEPKILYEAMAYGVLGGGKRIRAVLVYATGEALGVPVEQLDAQACAVEFIHGYSLIHDDLPAMDNDALRRGKPTCHIKYGESIALLAGDSLHSLAFETLTQDPAIRVSPQQRLDMVIKLAHTAGCGGMAGGQAIDLAAVGKDLSLAKLKQMHNLKTGALIRAAVALGALSINPVDPELAADLDDYARHIGLAFQIQDDILDVEGDTHTLGKHSGSDMAQSKPTYPALLGLEGAKQAAQESIILALASLESLGDNALFLRHIANYITQRSY